MLRKGAGNPRLRVCLFSPHAAVGEEWGDRLTHAGLEVFVRRSASTSPQDLRLMSVPRAKVYVVDDYAPRPTTEAIALGLRRWFPRSRMVAVGENFSLDSAFFYLRLGAKGLLSYAEARTRLPQAIRAVAAGGFWVNRRLLAVFVDSVLTSLQKRRLTGDGKHLSGREREVLDAVLENLSNKEIAQRLHITERTAKFHVSNLLAKFGVRRRADLIVLAFQEKRP